MKLYDESPRALSQLQASHLTLALADAKINDEPFQKTPKEWDDSKEQLWRDPAAQQDHLRYLESPRQQPSNTGHFVARLFPMDLLTDLNSHVTPERGLRAIEHC